MNDVTPRQTRTFLMKRFAEVGIHPKSRWGQNFLIDLNLLDVLIGAADIDRRDVILEIGGGTGSLTGMMALKAAHVVTVEIDRQMAQMARESLVGFDNVTLLEQDALKNKSKLSSAVLDLVRKHLEAEPGRRFKLAANLPYNVATPIISNLLACPLVPHSMTVTIQKELGDRIVAPHDTRDYSALSIWVQSQCRAEIVRIMPNTVFWPRPKVESAIVHIAVDPVKKARLTDPEFFHAFTRAMFFHRRKILRSELLSAFKNQLDKPAVDAVMERLGLAPDARAEQLTVERFLELSDAVRLALPPPAAGGKKRLPNAAEDAADDDLTADDRADEG